MASLMQSSVMPSVMRHQLSSITSTESLSSSFKSVRAFSLLCNSQRYTQKCKRNYLSTSSSKSLPAIQQSRTFFAKLARNFPVSTQATTKKPSKNANADASISETQKPTPELPLTNLPYFVRRTPSNQFPVYLHTGAGGTRRVTKIQKTEGDLEALKSDLSIALGLGKGPQSKHKKTPEISINPTNGHIIVKGWRKVEIMKFLAQRNF